MKKTNTTTASDVDQYLANVPEPARTTLHKIRATIRSTVPPEATMPRFLAIAACSR